MKRSSGRYPSHVRIAATLAARLKKQKVPLRYNRVYTELIRTSDHPVVSRERMAAMIVQLHTLSLGG